MRTPNPDEASVLKVEHVIRATHASTGQPIAPLDARWTEPALPGKMLTVIDGTIVVAMDQRYLPTPLPTNAPKLTIEIVVPDGPMAWRLDDPEKQLSVERFVVTGEMDHKVEFEPIPMTVTVDLVRPGAGANGGPSTAKTVVARSSNGVHVPLPEVAGEPGTYRSAARVWTAGFNPFDLLVGGSLVRRISIDFARTDTRLTVVDPT
jgi:hypothetical protein